MPEDRDVAVVWLEEQATRCKRCGTWRWEWDENPDAWFADHDTCEGCRRLDMHEDKLMKSPGSTHGVRLALYRTDREG